MSTGPGPEVLDALYQTILARRGADPESSYTAKLLHKGIPKIAQKLGEEAVEAVIEAVRGERAALAGECADLLYHLLVLLAALDLPPAEIYAALDKRRGTSGIDEKKSRGKEGGK
jgi:phosphoribosyl-ATP pyrophosphohydrolase